MTEKAIPLKARLENIINDTKPKAQIVNQIIKLIEARDMEIKGLLKLHFFSDNLDKHIEQIFNTLNQKNTEI